MKLKLINIFLLILGLTQAIPPSLGSPRQRQPRDDSDTGDTDDDDDTDPIDDGPVYPCEETDFIEGNFTLTDANATLTEEERAARHHRYLHVSFDGYFGVGVDQMTMSRVTGLHGHGIYTGQAKSKFFTSESSHWKFKCNGDPMRLGIRGHSAVIHVHRIVRMGSTWRSMYKTFSVAAYYQTYECGNGFVCATLGCQLNVCRKNGKWVKCGKV
ncbi:hypothetical protein V1506DRAFT_559126 [Lipomyces tetrasporus]